MEWSRSQTNLRSWNLHAIQGFGEYNVKPTPSIDENL
uniref:Uncharacterized protein n=1 Tax=Arundo donax TaxID=35708 RepID=A0A0A8YS89_ARUDO